MVYETDDHIVRDIGEYSVILHQVNTKGVMQQGISMALSKQFPNWYPDYHGYCGWFDKDGSMNFLHKDYTEDIIGTWHRYPVPGRNVIICSAFGQRGAGKEYVQTDLEAWEKIIKKLVLQTRRVNKIQPEGKKWTIHVPANLGCLGRDYDNSELMDMLNDAFAKSDDDLYIHERVVY